MSSVTVVKDINATAEVVFDCIAHIENYAEIQPDIVNVEFLSEQRRGVGTRFAETRRMKNREETVVLEVTEYNPPKSVRIVSDTHGTVWDTTFTVIPTSETTCRLTLTMEVRAYKWLAKVMNLFIMGMVTRHIEADMDQVKSACEAARGIA